MRRSNCAKALLIGGLLVQASGCATDPAPKTAAPPQSWSSQFSSSVKKSSDAVAATFSPPVERAPDPISLTAGTQPAKADFFLEAAKVYEGTGNLQAAATEYEKALKQEPNNAGTLLAYAHMKDRAGQTNDALALYQRCVKANPKDPAAHNDLGICLARLGKLDQAATEVAKAVELQPKKVLYRNNLAQIRVDQHKYEDAYKQLQAVHGDAVAYYNLGYLLSQKGDTKAAIDHVAYALRVDPNLVPAQQLLNKLTGQDTSVARRQSIPPSSPNPTPPNGGSWPQNNNAPPSGPNWPPVESAPPASVPNYPRLDSQPLMPSASPTPYRSSSAPRPDGSKKVTLAGLNVDIGPAQDTAKLTKPPAVAPAAAKAKTLPANHDGDPVRAAVRQAAAEDSASDYFDEMPPLPPAF